MTTITALLLGLSMAAGQAGPGQVASGRSAPEQNPQVSDTVFKNVRVLKGIPVDEFMDTMGMFASSLGYDCSSCHSPDIRTNREAFAVETPLVQRARGMITMVNAINRNYFAASLAYRASPATAATTTRNSFPAWLCSTASSKR